MGSATGDVAATDTNPVAVAPSIPKPARNPNYPNLLPPAAPGEVRNPRGVNGREDQMRIARELLREKAAELVRAGLEMCNEVRADTPACTFCGRGIPRPEEFRFRAIQAMLEKAGIGPTSTQKIEIDETKHVEIFLRFATDDELEQLEELFNRMKERAELEGAERVE